MRTESVPVVDLLHQEGIDPAEVLRVAVEATRPTRLEAEVPHQVGARDVRGRRAEAENIFVHLLTRRLSGDRPWVVNGSFYQGLSVETACYRTGGDPNATCGCVGPSRSGGSVLGANGVSGNQEPASRPL